MNDRRFWLLAALAFLPFVCVTAVAGCLAAGPCNLAMTAADVSPVLIVGPLLLVSGLVSVAVAIRFALTAGFAALELSRLQRLRAVPPLLDRLARVAGVTRLVCIRDDSPVAFCAGFLRPTVFMSDSAVAKLSQRELLAVLHHERDHAERHEPGLRAARMAAADVVQLPIVRWWCERQNARSELAADQAAERWVGSEAVAGALLVMTPTRRTLAAFTARAEMRARRLLGLEIEEPPVPPGAWATTLAAGWVATVTAACLFNALLALGWR